MKPRNTMAAVRLNSMAQVKAAIIHHQEAIRVCSS